MDILALGIIFIFAAIAGLTAYHATKRDTPPGGHGPAGPGGPSQGDRDDV